MGLVRSAPCWLGVLLVSASLPEAHQRTGVPGQRARALDEESVQETEEVRILVVDREGRPLPDAAVRFALEDERGGSIRDDSQPRGWRQALRLEQPPRASAVDGLLRHRPITPLESGGRLRVRWTKGRGLLIAGREGTRWGFRWFPRTWRETTGRDHPSDEPLRLELAEDWDLRVRVEDPGGHAVEGLGVTLWSPGPGVGLRWGAPSTQVFEHVGFDLRDASEPLEVRLSALVVPPVRVTLDPHRAPEQPVVLRLPPTGAVEVNVLGPDGRPTHERGTVVLSIAPDCTDAGRRFDQVRPGVSANVVEGKARFHGVSLGHMLEARLDDAPPVSLRGPSWAGETVSLTLSEPMTAPARSPTTESWPAAFSSVPSGSFGGSVRLDPDIPPAEIVAILRDLTGGQERRDLLPDGTFRFEDVETGTGWLELVPAALELISPAERPVLFRAELGLVAGENPTPQLDGIDLRGKLFRHELRVTGRDPALPFDARVFFSPSGRSLSSRAYVRSERHPLVLVTPWERLDVELFVTGYRSLSLFGLGPLTEVRLEPGITVRLRLVTDGILPDAPRYLKAFLRSASDPGRGCDWKGPAFGPARELVTTASGSGPNRVVWLGVTDGVHGIARELSPPQVLDVQDLHDPDVEQAFTVTIPADELARLMAQLDD